MQFFAYIAVWQINFTHLTKLCLLEIKRVVLVEYFDDFQLSKKVMNMLFEVPEEDELIEERVDGSGQFGGDIMKDFGMTLLVFSAVLTVVVLLIALTTYIIKRTGSQGKVRALNNKLKKTIFFNMLISYSLLNSLKFYILSFSFLNSANEIKEMVVGGLILLLCIVLPLMYALLLRKRESKLCL